MEASTALTTAIHTGPFICESPPRCRFCFQRSALLTVQPSNPNGNAGRPYFICRLCTGTPPIPPFPCTPISDTRHSSSHAQVGDPNANAAFNRIFPTELTGTHPGQSITTTSTSRWVTWNDTIGIADGNPKCDCANPSRLDKVGVTSTSELSPGTTFYSCAWGGCGFYALAKGRKTFKQEVEIVDTGLLEKRDMDGYIKGEEEIEEKAKGVKVEDGDEDEEVESLQALGSLLLDEVKEEEK